MSQEEGVPAPAPSEPLPELAEVAASPSTSIAAEPQVVAENTAAKAEETTPVAAPVVPAKAAKVGGRFAKSTTHEDLHVTHGGRGVALKPNQSGWRMGLITVPVMPGKVSHFEAVMQSQGDDSHARVGWAGKKANLAGNVGYDQFSYGYSDVTGKVFHERKGRAYGESWEAGDVIGCTIVRSATDRADVYFSKNGVLQGRAYANIQCRGQWFPAASVFGGAQLVLNLGPNFAHSPPNVEMEPSADSLEEPLHAVADRTVPEMEIENVPVGVAVETPSDLPIIKEEGLPAAMDVEEAALVDGCRPMSSEQETLKIAITDLEILPTHSQQLAQTAADRAPLVGAVSNQFDREPIAVLQRLDSPGNELKNHDATFPSTAAPSAGPTEPEAGKNGAEPLLKRMRPADEAGEDKKF